MPTNLLSAIRGGVPPIVPLLRSWVARRARPAADPVRALRLLAVAAVAVPTLLFGLAAALAYREATEEAANTVTQTARTVSEHASRLFDANRLLLDAILAGLGDAPSAEWADRERELHQMLHVAAHGLPQIRAVWYFDEHGVPVAHSRSFPASRDFHVRDRSYFQALREAAAEALFVSEPIVTKETGTTVFVVAQRRSLPDGRFAGVVMAALSPTYFTGFYDELRRTTPGLTLGLVRADGVRLARVPQLPSEARLEIPGPLVQSTRRGADAGTFTNIAPADGLTRIVSFRRLGAYPLYAVAALERGRVLAGWWQHVGVLAAFTFPLSFSLAAVAVLALRRTREERTAHRQKEEEAERRRRAESALHEHRRLEALGQLTGAVAHDFNNLLAVISNNVHLLRRVATSPAAQPQLAAISRSVETGARLTRQLLSFSRRQALKPEVLQFQRQMPAMVEVLQTTVGRQVRVSLEIDPGTPAVRVDQSELELAILNLAMNARDAMPHGGELRIFTRPATAEQGEGQVLLGVRDTGHGIPPELVSRVCEPFFTTKPVGKGTGLGLSQVHGFATQSGGRMEIRSEPGRFTEVLLLLPAAGAAAPSASGGADAALPRLAGRVLLVEDNPEVAAAVHDVLCSAGCEVVRAATGDEALQLLAAGRGVDLVLSDIVMPGSMNGLQLALQLRQSQPGLPVLLTTGYSGEVPRAREAGLSVLQKPVMPSVLLAEVAAVLAAPERAEAAVA